MILAVAAKYMFVLVTSLFVSVVSFQHFQNIIPNGDIVPDPCTAFQLWPGVGHLAKFGAGARNIFGLDFKSAGLEWTKDLCQMDSDGDGRTNGEELGDPLCTWIPGATPTTTNPANISHPGICDPVNSPVCNGQNICIPKELKCDPVDEEDVGVLNLTWPRTVVPAEETTYACITIDLYDYGLPANGSFDVIAIEPIIDNPRVMHHMIYTGCGSDAVADTEVDTQKSDCVFFTANCRETLFLWQIGHKGECFNQSYGFRIGEGGYTKMYIQIHWDNYALVSGYQDGSGMRFYYTTNLRPNNAVEFLTGPFGINIPPNRTDFSQIGTTDSLCFESLTQPINIVQITPHMHGLGRKIYVNHYRGGKHLGTLMADENYDFDESAPHQINPPIQLIPGDHLVTECVYDSIGRTETAHWGRGTYTEMCLPFIRYFPPDASIQGALMDQYRRQWCSAWGKRQQTMIDACDIEMFVASGELQKLNNACEKDECTQHCNSTIQELRNTSCLHWQVYAQLEPKVLDALLEDDKQLIDKLYLCETVYDWRATEKQEGHVNSDTTVQATEFTTEKQNDPNSATTVSATQVILSTLISVTYISFRKLRIWFGMA